MSTELAPLAGNLSFSFEAMTAGGVMEQGSIHAPSLLDARRAVINRGLLLLTIRQTEVHVRRTQLRVADLGLGLRILADLLDAGLSAGRALKALEDLAPPAWRSAIPALQQSIREGNGLAAALASGPIEIPAVVIGITASGRDDGSVGGNPSCGSLRSRVSTGARECGSTRHCVAHRRGVATLRNHSRGSRRITAAGNSIRNDERDRGESWCPPRRGGRGKHLRRVACLAHYASRAPAVV